MNITHFTPRLADDLTVVVDGAETIQIYKPDFGSLSTVFNCVAQTIKVNKTPSESPQGATILERKWNCPATSQGAINDIIFDSQDQRWQIVSIERKERIGRVVYRARQIDLSPRLDEWVDIITPIYQTDNNGAPYLQKYQADATGVSVRIIRVPASSHRQLMDVPEERIEIVFADSAIRIGAKQRIRLSDGSIYKPTDLFPITQTRPALRIIAQREAVGSRQ